VAIPEDTDFNDDQITTTNGLIIIVVVLAALILGLFYFLVWKPEITMERKNRILMKTLKDRT
jgi:hypothetical protein